MIALTLKRARVSVYGDGIINLNEDRVPQLSEHAALERGIVLWRTCPFTEKKKLTPSFPCLLPISCLLFIYYCWLNFLGGNLQDFL